MTPLPASIVFRGARTRRSAFGGIAEASVAGFKQSCMQFTNKIDQGLFGKMDAGGVDDRKIGVCCEISARECFKTRDYLL
jgi:hypothetical protein